VLTMPGTRVHGVPAHQVEHANYTHRRGAATEGTKAVRAAEDTEILATEGTEITERGS
jgi:hypothetical protein